MHWTLKAVVQNAVAALPARASHAVYYWLQRHAGDLRRFDVAGRLAAGVETCRRLRNQGIRPEGRVFFEGGTGRAPLAAVAFWLLGAERTLTVDLHRYVTDDLVTDSYRFIADHEHDVADLCGPQLDRGRFVRLLDLARSRRPGLAQLLALCGIEYRAPADASATGLPAGSVDVHTSHNVCEHVPPAALEAIFREGRRLLRPSGVFVHRVDYSEHFAQSDPRLSAIHFLRFTDRQWARCAGNRFMYANRLRHDDCVSLVETATGCTASADPIVDQAVLEAVRAGSLPVDARFREKPPEVLATTSAWILAGPVR